MKRALVFFMAISMVFVFGTPAPAQEKSLEERVKALEETFGTWSFYGSARFLTFYQKSDNNAFTDSDKISNLTGPDQKTTQWALANNSRLGATVNKGDLGGRVELGLQDSSSVSLRLMYGTYTYNGVTFLFGQDYTPLGDYGNYCSQVFAGDLTLKGWGLIDENTTRTPQVKIRWKGLQVALVQSNGTNPKTSANTVTFANAYKDPVTGVVTNPRTENLMPHLEARYTLKMDQFFGDVFGGVNTFKIKDKTAKYSYDIDKTVNAYALGLGGGLTLNPIYANAMAWMGRNCKQLGLHQADSAGAQYDVTTDKLTNDKDFGWMAVVGAKIETINFETGYGFVSSELDKSGSIKDKAQSYYLNASIPVAKTKLAKFTVVPEIGVFDYMKDAKGADQGKVTYAGAKWQVDF